MKIHPEPDGFPVKASFFEKMGPGRPRFLLATQQAALVAVSAQKSHLGLCRPHWADCSGAVLEALGLTKAHPKSCFLAPYSSPAFVVCSVREVIVAMAYWLVLQLVPLWPGAGMEPLP